MPALVVAVLVLAFYIGGNAPGSRGWGVAGSESGGAMSTLPTETPEAEAPEPSPEESDDPAGAETDAPEPSPEASQAPDGSPEPSPEPTDDPAELPDYGSLIVQPTMNIDPSTGQDKYKTDPVPTGKPLPVSTVRSLPSSPAMR